MARSSKTKYRSVTIKQLVRAVSPKEQLEPTYTFSNGRTFYKKRKR